VIPIATVIAVHVTIRKAINGSEVKMASIEAAAAFTASFKPF
jgi:hypothetical protein